MNPLPSTERLRRFRAAGYVGPAYLGGRPAHVYLRSPLRSRRRLHPERSDDVA
jgi:hypothetical protein